MTAAGLHRASAQSITFAQPDVDRRNWIAGLEKGLAILQSFDLEHDRLTASEAARLSGMTRSSARRHLMMLQYLGYVEGDGRIFWLKPKVLRLGSAYLQSARFPRAVQPLLQRFTAMTSESAFAAVLDDDELVYVARNVTNRPVPGSFSLGARMPPFVTSAGMVLLASVSMHRAQELLDRYVPKPHTPSTLLDKERIAQEIVSVRRLGYAVCEEQLEPGLRGIAVVLRNHRAEIVGALGVSCRMAGESAHAAVLRLVPALQQLAADFRSMQ